MRCIRAYQIFFIALATVAVFPTLAHADSLLPSITINTGSGRGVSESEVFAGLKLTFLVSSIVFLPSLFMAVTCFSRVMIVLSLTRQAIGVAQTPPNQVLVGLALFLTFAIMGPVFNTAWQDGLSPYLEDQISHTEAMEKVYNPFREFMLRHTREQDLGLFLEVTKTPAPDSPEKLGPAVVVPAFLVSELNTAFQISFLIFLPFLVLDMIISSVLTSMSMITLPPTVISLPIKLMLFVVVDGWHLIIGNLVKSYHT